MVLPILTVVILSIGARMRMTRTNMLEVLNSDYIRTARAKGLNERSVIYKHAFRNTRSRWSPALPASSRRCSAAP